MCFFCILAESAHTAILMSQIIASSVCFNLNVTQGTARAYMRMAVASLGWINKLAAHQQVCVYVRVCVCLHVYVHVCERVCSCYV